MRQMRQSGSTVALFGRLPREHKVLPELGIVMALYSRDAGDEARARMILETVLRHQVDPRRLVTTEIIVQGPKYVGARLSLGITVAG